MDKSEQRISELENEIARLPVGYISKKIIAGKARQYHQWTENGKKKSKYIDDATAENLSQYIEQRKNLQQELKTLKALFPQKKIFKTEKTSKKTPKYKSDVICGEELASLVKSVKKFKARACLSKLQSYLNNDTEKVFILYGLRRTGKTTLIRQAIAGMSKEDFSGTAFIQIRVGDTLGDFNQDLKLLQKQGFRYIFIDEVTFMEEFIDGGALFSDVYCTSGMKIVLSGTDSLGFMFSEDEELYDRCILLHTTLIPYKEFEDVLGIHGIDEYIRYGGTMSLGGINYNERATFANAKSTNEYVDTAIANNIQHSLQYYKSGIHFASLQSLYEQNELTNVINRVVEDINHRFTLEVLTRDFESHDLGLSAKNLRKDREKPTDILDLIDKKVITKRLKEILEIRNRREQTIEITDSHRRLIREYLKMLDLIVDIPIEKIPVDNREEYQAIVSQPGMRYSQAKALIEQLLLDSKFQTISAMDRAEIIERILSEVRGRMMEEIILLETKMAFPPKKVFRLQFPVGEYDMVILDPEKITCEIFEIKHSAEAIKDQYRHLVDEKKCADTEFRYGKITRKCVLYRGPSQIINEIEYKNVEEYLRTI